MNVATTNPRPLIMLLFGEMGAGKTYWATKLALEHDFTYVEGDLLVPDDMAARVEKFKFPTKPQLQNLISRLANVPEMYSIEGRGLVIAQALYLNADREYLIQYWTALGYDVMPVWVKVGFWQNLKQLWKRPKGWKWVVYWLLNKPFFQRPTHVYIPG